MIATRANMEKLKDRPGVFVFSPETGERYSATPGDYFLHNEHKALTDSEGNNMVLAYERTTIHEFNPDEQLGKVIG